MKSRKKHHVNLSSAALVLLMVVGLALILRYATLLDISGSTAHTVSLSGHDLQVQALPSFGSSQYVCGGKQPSITDETTTDAVRVTGRIPNTGSRDCSDYTIGVTVTLKDVDLTTKERVLIKRAARISSYAKGGNGYSSDLNGLTGGSSSRDGPITKTWGDVTITNDRAARVLRIYGDGDDANGKIIVYGNNSVYFTNTISTSTKSIAYDASMTYTITGIEITEFPTPPTTSPAVPSTTTPVTPLPSVPGTPAPAPATEATHGLFARLWTWIKGWFG